MNKQLILNIEVGGTMAELWLVEIGKGAAKLLLNPVFYLMFFYAAWLGVSRVKKERRDFSVRAENAYFELRQLLPLGLLLGLIFSIIMTGAGLAVPLETVVFAAALTVLLSLTGKVRWLSPVYTLGFAFFLTTIAVQQKWPIPSWLQSVIEGDAIIFPAVAVLAGLMLIGEGILIARNGSKGTSPRLMKSKRGQIVGAHEVKRVWMVPVFLLIPGDALQTSFEWWPVFSIGDNVYSLILVPFAVGFYQHIQSSLPKLAVKNVGRRITVLGALVLLTSIAAYWYPIVAVAAITGAILGREILALRNRVQEDNATFYFSKQNHALMILAIIPNTPASKMALQVGEMITKVNGVKVSNENGFYEALQKNRAHCKLEVLDVNGEVRFVQRALYEGDHHELGILFVQNEKKWGNEAV